MKYKMNFSQTHEKELDQIKNVFDGLFDHVSHAHYRGYDPYDGLNSKLLKSTPLYISPFVRLCWIQFFKKCHFNFRKIAGVPEGFNAKAGALFLTGSRRMFAVTGKEQYKKACFNLVDLIKQRVVRRTQGCAWGYNFPWQAKAFYVPARTPNVVTSVYVGSALIDFYETFGIEEVKSFILGVRDFIVNEMIVWEKDKTLCFSYIPGEKAEVHNANLLTAAFLSRVNQKEQDKRLSELVKKAVRFSTNDVERNGFWPYGTMSHHRWMDNFHTAFNLEALLTIKKYTNRNEYDGVIKTVFDYYTINMFLSDGMPKYYNNRLYPIDIHVIAEAIIFLTQVYKDNSDLFSISDKEKASKLVEFLIKLAINEFWDKKGYFYYQKNKCCMNKIPYMRWSQAWMFYALSGLIENNSR